MATTLTQRAATHMNAISPNPACGGWVVAEDHRDGTAVVVYRTDPGWPQAGVRGTTLYRWLCALRDAGFTAEARLDLEVFGKPDEQSEIAHWLHTTGWSDAEPFPARGDDTPVPC